MDHLEGEQSALRDEELVCWECDGEEEEEMHCQQHLVGPTFLPSYERGDYAQFSPGLHREDRGESGAQGSDEERKRKS